MGSLRNERMGRFSNTACFVRATAMAIILLQMITVSGTLVWRTQARIPLLNDQAS
jgi:hypothetical protein